MARFPFGADAGVCPPKPHDTGESAEVFVLGVYPSAVHVRWTPPPDWTPPRGVAHGIRALAVAPEPWPFWDGHDSAERVSAWEQAHWDPAWGTVADVGPQLNGSSGRWFAANVLRPLGASVATAWLTDAVDRFFVHAAGQGKAMAERYDPFAAATPGLEPHDLPRRPSTSALVAEAVAEHRDRLTGELRDSGAARAVTLGNEALSVLSALAEDGHGLPERLSPARPTGRRTGRVSTAARWRSCRWCTLASGPRCGETPTRAGWRPNADGHRGEPWETRFWPAAVVTASHCRTTGVTEALTNASPP